MLPWGLGGGGFCSTLISLKAEYLFQGAWIPLHRIESLTNKSSVSEVNNQVCHQLIDCDLLASLVYPFSDGEYASAVDVEL